MALDSMKEIFERSARENIPFWEIVLQYDMEERQVSRQASMAKMLSTWQAIQDAADSYTGTQRSVSGLVGGDGLKMRLYARRGESIGGEFMDEVIVQAISMAESNACMRRIVAAPTAGSCGVVPAVLLPLCEREHYTQHELLEALYVASGIGAVIAFNPEASVEENREAMTAAAEQVKTGQITFAVRDTVFEDKEIKEGDIIGIHNGRIEVVGKSIHDIALELVKHVVEDGDSLITIYYGQDTQQEDADALGAEVAEMFSDLDVEVQYGGQPLYYYLISAE